MRDPFLDEQFLKDLSKVKQREIQIRLTALNIYDEPMEVLEGMLTGGSVNIDGNSAVRRSCSLTLVATDPAAAITKPYWALKNRFQVEIGILNEINEDYPRTIWFSQGVYIISSFTTSQTLNNLTINIQGKDKMCLLNGEIGGSIMTQSDFGVLEEYDSQGVKKFTKLSIRQIIYNLIKEYTFAKPENIIINDLEDYGYEAWEYYGDVPLYLILDTSSGSVKVANILFEQFQNDEPSIKDQYDKTLYSLEQYYSLQTLDASYNLNATSVYFNNEEYKVARIEAGQVAGYHQILLTYFSDLIGNVGESITSILDKIKQMLGEFEYFYDLKGRFIFQKKRTYVQELFSPIKGGIFNPTMITTPYAYKFEDWSMFNSMPNSSNIGNVKNDFSVWGSTKNANGTELPIHSRYAICNKPIKYKSRSKTYTSVEGYVKNGWGNKNRAYDEYYIKFPEELELEDVSKLQTLLTEILGDYAIFTLKPPYALVFSEDNSVGLAFLLQAMRKFLSNSLPVVDGFKETEIKDLLNQFFDFNNNSNADTEDLGEFITFKSAVDFQQRNIQFNSSRLSYFLQSTIESKEFTVTEDEDIEFTATKVDWREIIYQMALDFYKYGQDPDFYIQLEKDNPQYIGGITGYEQFYYDIQGYWRELYNPMTLKKEDNKAFYPSNSKYAYWNKKIHTDPSSLPFWFDFLEVQPDKENETIGNYSINEIGAKTKAVNDKNITSVYGNAIPEVCYLGLTDEYDYKMAYTPIWLPEEYLSLFYKKSSGLSAIEQTNNLIYQHACLPETLTLNVIPIYHLQPNTRIWIKDKGDYIITKLTYNFTHNGMMSMSCNKIIKQFF